MGTILGFVKGDTRYICIYVMGLGFRVKIWVLGVRVSGGRGFRIVYCRGVWCRVENVGSTWFLGRI